MTAEDWLCILEMFAIVIVGLIMAYAEFAQAIKYRKSWIKYGLGFMGLYWAAYYSYSLYCMYFNLRLQNQPVFIRSGILLTLALVGGYAFMTLRALEKLDK